MPQGGSPYRRPTLRRDAQQWVYDWVVKETGRVFHFQPDGRGGLPRSVRSHAMISKHLGQLARRYERIARQEAEAGHDRTALNWYFDAATLFAEAQHTIFTNSREKKYLHQSSLRCYDEVRKRSPYVIEHVDIPWGDTYVSGNLHLAPGEGPKPCVFFIPGCDMTKEMSPHPHFNHAHQRGMHIFVFDGPGQGESNLRDIRLTTSNYEDAASTALTYLADRPEVDAERIGVLGLSFGSYWAVRFAGSDSRVAAVAAPWASVCDKTHLMEYESPRYKQLFSYLTRSTNEEELDRFVAEMTLDEFAQELRCPVLLAVGEYDPRSPLDEVYEFWRLIESPKELWVFADQHHMASVKGNASGPLWNFDIYDFTFDWLADRVRGVPMKNNGATLYLNAATAGPSDPNARRSHLWFDDET